MAEPAQPRDSAQASNLNASGELQGNSSTAGLGGTRNPEVEIPGTSRPPQSVSPQVATPPARSVRLRGAVVSVKLSPRQVDALEAIDSAHRGMLEVFGASPSYFSLVKRGLARSKFIGQRWTAFVLTAEGLQALREARAPQGSPPLHPQLRGRAS